MKVKKLMEVFTRSKRGDAVTYHTGLLMRDRQHDETLNQTAAAAWALYDRGEALLFQRRAGESCDYLIVKV